MHNVLFHFHFFSHHSIFFCHLVFTLTDKFDSCQSAESEIKCVILNLIIVDHLDSIAVSLSIGDIVVELDKYRIRSKFK